MSDAVSSKFQKKHLISFGIPDKYHGQAMAALRDMACSRETLVGICASLAYLVSSPDTAQHTLGMSHPMQPLAHALAKRKKEIVESQLPDDAKPNGIYCHFDCPSFRDDNEKCIVTKKKAQLRNVCDVWAIWAKQKLGLNDA